MDGVGTTFTNVYSVWANGVLTPWKWASLASVGPEGEYGQLRVGRETPFGGLLLGYPATVSYNGTSVTLYWEQRSDLETRANGIDFAQPITGASRVSTSSSAPARAVLQA